MVERTKIRFCACGCKKVVKKPGARFIRGHHMREKVRDTEYRAFIKDRFIKRMKQGVKRKYGVENTAHIAGVAEKRVATRKARYSHWIE